MLLRRRDCTLGQVLPRWSRGIDRWIWRHECWWQFEQSLGSDGVVALKNEREVWKWRQPVWTVFRGFGFLRGVEKWGRELRVFSRMEEMRVWCRSGSTDPAGERRALQPQSPGRGVRSGVNREPSRELAFSGSTDRFKEEESLIRLRQPGGGGAGGRWGGRAPKARSGTVEVPWGGGEPWEVLREEHPWSD